MLADILPNAAVPYFRFNPEIPTISLDETSVHKLRELQGAGREFMTHGDGLSQCRALVQVRIFAARYETCAHLYEGFPAPACAC